MTDDFGMFSRKGNRAVATMVAKALELDAPTEFLQHEVYRISLEHPEIYDTAVREAIAKAMGDPSLAYWALTWRPPLQ